jgi:hypothetical protein
VSSYTSSSDAHRRFTTWFLGLVLVPVSVLFGLSAYLQPLYGDLVRVGAYAENDFGWNKPQQSFPRPLYGNAPYDHYYDVVVLGDSFSTQRPNLQWQNYVVAAKGLSVITLDINKMNLAQVLDSPVFRNTPPRLFILETVERELTRRLQNEPPCVARALPGVVAVAAGSSADEQAVKFQEQALQGWVKPIARDTASREAKLGYARDYLWKGLQRKLRGRASGNAEKIELAGDAPFSSSTRNAMLVFRNDIRKAQWWREMGLPQIGCRIERMRDQAEANGHTRFILMVAPDKLTAYADFLRDTNLRNLSALAELSGHHPDIMPRLDLALTAAIRKGEQDVYLPDDTHWGSSGDRIAAETLLSFLRQPGSL